MNETLLENELVPLLKRSLAVHPQLEIIWLRQVSRLHTDRNQILTHCNFLLLLAMMIIVFLPRLSARSMAMAIWLWPK
jgi:hypothetical protein